MKEKHVSSAVFQVIRGSSMFRKCKLNEDRRHNILENPINPVFCEHMKPLCS